MSRYALFEFGAALCHKDVCVCVCACVCVVRGDRKVRFELIGSAVGEQLRNAIESNLRTERKDFLYLRIFINSYRICI